MASGSSERHMDRLGHYLDSRSNDYILAAKDRITTFRHFAANGYGAKEPQTGAFAQPRHFTRPVRSGILIPNMG
jgi:hypothetical protein